MVGVSVLVGVRVIVGVRVFVGVLVGVTVGVAVMVGVGVGVMFVANISLLTGLINTAVVLAANSPSLNDIRF